MPAKRIRFKVDGKLVSILRNDWDIFKRRFDQENAKERDTLFEILMDCPLCAKFLDRNLGTCMGCTFKKFEKKHDDSGCGNALGIILGGLTQFSTTEKRVYFFKSNAVQARAQLNRLLAFMISREEG